MSGEAHWYLLRTKHGEERRAQANVARIAVDTLLPLVRAQVRRHGRLTSSVQPFYPSYLFALLGLEQEWHRLRYTRGLRQVVTFGGSAAVVPDWVIDQLKRRCAHGPMELPSHIFLSDEAVKIVGGPFREFEGMFERYVNGTERVAILLRAMSRQVRTVLPAATIHPLDSLAHNSHFWLSAARG